jgi:hypothetical protein
VAWKASSASWTLPSTRRQTPRTIAPWRRTRAAKVASSRWSPKRRSNSLSAACRASSRAVRARRYETRLVRWAPRMLRASQVAHPLDLCIPGRGRRAVFFPGGDRGAATLGRCGCSRGDRRRARSPLAISGPHGASNTQEGRFPPRAGGHAFSRLTRGAAGADRGTRPPAEGAGSLGLGLGPRPGRGGGRPGYLRRAALRKGRGVRLAAPADVTAPVARVPPSLDRACPGAPSRAI